MRNPRLLIAIAAALVLLFSASYAVAAPSSVFEPTILPQATNTYDLGSSALVWRKLYTNQICLTGDCKTAWPSGSGGTGNVATSSAETSGYIPFWTSTAATPATLSGGSANFTWDNTASLLSIVGNASTSQLTATSSAYLATLGGSVGIGTTNPQSTLHVSGGDITIDNNKWLNFRNAANSANLNVLQVDNGNNVNLKSTSVAPIRFLTGSSESARISANVGFLGIGTTTPNYSLTVSSSTGPQVGLTDGANEWALRSVGGALYFATSTYSATSSTRLTLASTGNVGIGNTNPTYALEVTSPSNIITQFTNATGVAKVLINNGTNIFYQTNNHTLGFMGWGWSSIDTQASAVLTEGGNFGVGSTTPWGQLSASSTSAYPTLAIEQKSTGPAAIFVGGKVGIGSTSPAYPLDVATTGNDLGHFFTTSAIANFFIDSGGASGRPTLLFQRSGATLAGLYVDSSNTLSLGVTSNPITNRYLNITSAGKVGISTTTPEVTLDVYHAGQDYSARGTWGLAISNLNKELGLGYDATVDAGYIQAVDKGIAFKNLILEASGGKVGIGTTTPYAPLSVVGQTVSAYFTATTSTASTFPYASTTALTVSGAGGLQLDSGLSGVLKATSGLVSTASNGTDYTLITANSCSAGNHVSGITAAGIISCSADSGGSGTSPIATSSVETSGYFPVWTSTNGTPATLAGTSQIFQSSTNVGIGTTTPTNPLTLPAGSLAVPALSFGDTKTGFLRAGVNVNQYAVNGVATFNLTASGIGFATGDGITNSAGSSNGFIQLNANGIFASRNVADASAAFRINQTNSSATGDVLDLLSNSATTTVFTQAGLVGIGTTSPYAALSVFTGGDYGSHAASTLFAIGSSTAGTATTTLFTVLSSGNVGIGTTTPQNPLSLSAGTVSIPSISFGDTATGLFRSAINAIGFAISGVEKMTLNATGLGVASTTPWATLSIGNQAGVWPFAIGSSTSPTALFGVSDYGAVTLTANQPATSTAITLDWAHTGQQVEYRIGSSATTITLINATTTQYWGTTKRVWVCNPAQTAGAVTWVGLEWIGTAPTQTTTSNACDLYFLNVTRATSTSAYKVGGAANTNFQ